MLLQLDCYCQNGLDKAVDTCAAEGATAGAPFECPLDQVFRVQHFSDVPALHGPALPHRPPAYLAQLDDKLGKVGGPSLRRKFAMLCRSTVLVPSLVRRLPTHQSMAKQECPSSTSAELVVGQIS